MEKATLNIWTKVSKAPSISSTFLLHTSQKKTQWSFLLSSHEIFSNISILPTRMSHSGSVFGISCPWKLHFFHEPWVISTCFFVHWTPCKSSWDFFGCRSYSGKFMKIPYLHLPVPFFRRGGGSIPWPWKITKIVWYIWSKAISIACKDLKFLSMYSAILRNSQTWIHTGFERSDVTHLPGVWKPWGPSDHGLLQLVPAPVPQLRCTVSSWNHPTQHPKKIEVSKISWTIPNMEICSGF